MKNTILIAIVALSQFGCNTKTAETNASLGGGIKSVSTERMSGHDSKNSPAEANNAVAPETKPQEPGMDLAKIPAALKSDAYDYYGLGRTDPVKMTVTKNGSSEPATETVRLTKVDAGVAEFTISNDGGLVKLGKVLVSLDKNGIKVVSVDGQKADSETYELPNGLTKGKSWPSKLQNGNLQLTCTNVVSGTESVTTSVGTYKDALLVISTASGEQDGQKVQVKSKQWLVKGRGQVKADITYVSGKTTQSVSMEESK